ncbi:MAG: hypothetical protein R2856_37455 [Caldilineaceae bacterium]
MRHVSPYLGRPTRVRFLLPIFTAIGLALSMLISFGGEAVLFAAPATPRPANVHSENDPESITVKGWVVAAPGDVDGLGEWQLRDGRAEIGWFRSPRTRRSASPAVGWPMGGSGRHNSRRWQHCGHQTAQRRVPRQSGDRSPGWRYFGG